MRMTRKRSLLLGAVLLAGGWTLAPPRASSAPVNKLEVKGIEIAHRLGAPGIKVRLTMISREAVEFSTEEPVEVQSTLQMAEIFGSGRGKMFAEVEGRVVRALHVAVE
jgi:hypothetical protein